jgi:hypothetical protein
LYVINLFKEEKRECMDSTGRAKAGSGRADTQSVTKVLTTLGHLHISAGYIATHAQKLVVLPVTGAKK